MSVPRITFASSHEHDSVHHTAPAQEGLPKIIEEVAPPIATRKGGGWDGARGEAAKIVSATIRYNPLGFVRECVKQMFRQFVTFAPGVDNEPIQNDRSPEDFRELYPEEMSRYVLSRQSIGRLVRDGERVAPICATVFWCSLGINLIALFARRLRTGMANRLFLLTLIFLFANAMATGAFSGVVDRYQARASWLMAICCAAYIISFLAQRTNEGRWVTRSS